MHRVLLHPEAEKELRESILWYKIQRDGLEKEFVKCIDEAIERIKKNPETFPIIYKNLRKVVVKKFPFIIIYDFTHLQIRVLAVFHSKRNPKTFQKRN